jgi:hypothetical protein
MKLQEYIKNKKDTVEIDMQELKILVQIQSITNSIFELQELIIDYEQWGYDVNNIKPFLYNYPLKHSIFDYNPNNQWGDKAVEKSKLSNKGKENK